MNNVLARVKRLPCDTAVHLVGYLLHLENNQVFLSTLLPHLHVPCGDLQDLVLVGDDGQQAHEASRFQLGRFLFAFAPDTPPRMEQVVEACDQECVACTACVTRKGEDDVKAMLRSIGKALQLFTDGREHAHLVSIHWYTT